MGSNPQALVKSLHAGFVDSLLSKYRRCDRRRQNRGHAKKFEIGHRRIPPSVGPVRIVRGPLTERLASGFRYSLTREIVKSRSLPPLRGCWASMPIGLRVCAPAVLFCEPHALRRESAGREYIVALNN